VNINTIYSKPLWRPGATATSTFDNYYVNGMKIEGTHTLTNNSNMVQLIFTSAVANGKLTGNDETFIQWSGTRVFTQKEGWSTLLDPSDDLYAMVSQGSGSVTKNDNTYTWNGYTIEPLEQRPACQWVSKGIQGIEGTSGAQGTIDFGNGDCDNKAVLLVNGVSGEITLK
ncbi:MAG: hypothetical protein QM664_08685, partial [Flavihumibacter sp.]